MTIGGLRRGWRGGTISSVNHGMTGEPSGAKWARRLLATEAGGAGAAEAARWGPGANHMRLIGGVVLLVAGAGLDFWPVLSWTSGGPPTVSFWQLHDLCTSGLGELGQMLLPDVATSCTTVTVIWLAGIGLMLAGAFVALSSFFRPSVPGPPAGQGPRWAAPPSPPSSPPPEPAPGTEPPEPPEKPPEPPETA